jgi:hypothetical protein
MRLAGRRLALSYLRGDVCSSRVGVCPPGMHERGRKARGTNGAWTALKVLRGRTLAGLVLAAWRHFRAQRPVI